jgi:hypothetical protein
MTTNDIIQALEVKELVSFFYPFKVVFILVSALLIFGIAWYYIKQGIILNDVKRRTKDFLSFQRYTPPRSFSTRCREINNMLDKGDYKRATMRMEELFYELLKRYNYSGKTLKQMVEDPSIPDVDNLRRLAEVAEGLKKDRNYSIDIEELDKLFESFDRTLEKFGVITDEVID